MTRQFLAFAAQLAVITAAIVGVLYLVGVDPKWVKIAALVGVGVLALSALIVALSRLPIRRAERKDDGSRAAKASRRARARSLRRRVRGFFRALRRDQPGIRLWYREKAAPPLWLVLGPKGHGKSTLLQCAPELTELCRLEEQAIQAGPTPHFFAGGGLSFIELPEEFNGDVSSSRVLLREIRRRRRRQPISGVIVVARLDTLDDAAATALEPTYAQLRLIANELSVRPPVVFTWTHLDRLPGLGVLCSGLGDVKRPFGTTLPPCETRRSIAAALSQRLEATLQWTAARSHALLVKESSDTAAPYLYSLWQQLDDLAPRISAAVAGLAAKPLVGGETLQPRAIYLVAPTASGTPDTGWLDRWAERAGGDLPSPGLDAPPTPAFVAELFTRELPRDSQLATRLRPFRWRRASLQALASTSAAGLAVIASFSVHNAAQEQFKAQQETLDALDGRSLHVEPRPIAPDQLLPLEKSVRGWREPADGLRWGLFRGDLLAAPTAQIYQALVCRSVLHPLAQQQATELRRFLAMNSRESRVDDSFLRADRALQLYTSLTAPPSSCRPWGDDPRAFARSVANAWAQGSDDELTREQAKAVLSTFADVNEGLSCDEATALWDPALARDVSAVLTRRPPEDRVLASILNDINQPSTLGLKSTSLVGTRLKGSHIILQSFTREGWRAVQERIKEEVQKYDRSECYLASDQRRDAYEYCGALRAKYTQRYKRAWSDAIGSLSIEGTPELAASAALIRDLLDESPLERVFAAVQENTQDLDPFPCRPTNGEALAEAADSWWSTRDMNKTRLLTNKKMSDDPEAKDIANTFAPFADYGAAPTTGRAGAGSGDKGLPLDNYVDELRGLLKDLEAESATKEDVERRRQRVLDELNTGAYGSWKSALSQILLPPFNSVILHLDEDYYRNLNTAWCEHVIAPMQQSVIGRYPFVRGSRDQVSLKDLAHIFHPTTGEIAKFRDEHLSGFVDVTPTEISHKPLTKGARGLSSSARRFLNDAYGLGILLFGEDAEPSLDLGISVSCATSRETINRLQITLDDQVIDYICGPKKKERLHWPGEGGDSSRLAFTGKGNTKGGDIVHDAGPFGLLHLLESGRPKRKSKGHSFESSISFKKYGELRLTFVPQTRYQGSIFFGFGDSRTFLAPWRSQVLVRPPQSLIDGLSFSCAGVAP